MVACLVVWWKMSSFLDSRNKICKGIERRFGMFGNRVSLTWFY